MRQRPLSPHLQVYRFRYTMATSIFHRATGIALSVGLLVLVAWLMAAAAGAETYARVIAVLGAGLAQFAIAGWIVAFCYHLCNGLRHLNWDLGRGLEKPEARRSAAVVAVATFVLAGLFVYVAFFAEVPR